MLMLDALNKTSKYSFDYNTVFLPIIICYFIFLINLILLHSALLSWLLHTLSLHSSLLLSTSFETNPTPSAQRTTGDFRDVLVELSCVLVVGRRCRLRPIVLVGLLGRDYRLCEILHHRGNAGGLRGVCCRRRRHHSNGQRWYQWYFFKKNILPKIFEIWLPFYHS